MMPDAVLLRLNWPSGWLSPNRKDGSRAARHAHYRAKGKAIDEAWAEAKAQGLPSWPDARLVFTFYPPDRRRRDIQNMPAMLKAHIDGIAKAMGCDDNGFRVAWPEAFADPVKGGAVLVEVHAGVTENIELRGIVT